MDLLQQATELSRPCPAAGSWNGRSFWERVRLGRLQFLFEVRYVCGELAGMLLTDARQRPLASGELDARALQALRMLERGQGAADMAPDMGLDTGEYSRVLGQIWDRAAARRAQGQPTTRERELIALIADGCTRKEAAAQMSISVMTVSSYLKAIKSKYLASHPGVPPTITPLAVARRWARESGLPPARLVTH